MAVQSPRTASFSSSRDARSTSRDPQNSPSFPAVEPKGLPILPESFDSDLTPAQCMAITHLMAGKSLTSVATLLNIDRKTLYNWRQLPAFRATLHSLCHEACEAAAMRMRNLLLRGTHKLTAMLESTPDFNEVLRLVSNKRVWDMAQMMPQTETLTTSTDETAEPEASIETAPEAPASVEADGSPAEPISSKSDSLPASEQPTSTAKRELPTNDRPPRRPTHSKEEHPAHRPQISQAVSSVALPLQSVCERSRLS